MRDESAVGPCVGTRALTANATGISSSGSCADLRQLDPDRAWRGPSFNNSVFFTS